MAWTEHGIRAREKHEDPAYIRFMRWNNEVFKRIADAIGEKHHDVKNWYPAWAYTADAEARWRECAFQLAHDHENPELRARLSALTVEWCDAWQEARDEWLKRGQPNDHKVAVAKAKKAKKARRKPRKKS